MKLDEFKTKYPDIYQAILEEGEEKGRTTGLAEGEEKGYAKGLEKGKAEGAEAERRRIQAVEDQAMTGHEPLIQTLKFDGETTGEQAAVKVLQAEKAIRRDVTAQLDEDAPEAVPHATTPEVETPKAGDKNLPFDERVQAAWDRDADLRSEFGNNLGTYQAYCKAEERGQIRLLSK